jgi:hypothetical protein
VNSRFRSLWESHGWKFRRRKSLGFFRDSVQEVSRLAQQLPAMDFERRISPFQGARRWACRRHSILPSYTRQCQGHRAVSYAIPLLGTVTAFRVDQTDSSSTRSRDAYFQPSENLSGRHFCHQDTRLPIPLDRLTVSYSAPVNYAVING